MESSKDGMTAGNTEKRARPTEGDLLIHQQTNTTERSHVDVLLEFSEEDLLNEHEQHEHSFYSSADECVKGWARLPPMSCMHVTEKKCKKPKNKEADISTPPVAEPTHSQTEYPVNDEKQNSEHRGSNKSLPLYQEDMLVQSNAPEWTAYNSIQTSMANLSIGRKQDFTLQPALAQTNYLLSPVENRTTKPPKYIHRPNDTLVPIRNYTFLPPIRSPQLSPNVGRYLCRGKAPDGELFEETVCTLDKKHVKRGSRMETFAKSYTYNTGMTSKLHGSQFNPPLFPAAYGSVPKRYRVPVFSTPPIVHRTRHSVGRNISQAIAQPRLHSKCLFS